MGIWLQFNTYWQRVGSQEPLECGRYPRRRSPVLVAWPSAAEGGHSPQLPKPPPRAQALHVEECERQEGKARNGPLQKQSILG